MSQGSLNRPVEVSYVDSGNIDAFSRLRTSEPITVFSVQTQYNASPLQMEAGNTGTGVAPSHSANTRMVALSATTGSGTSFVQSYQYCAYQPGKSHLFFLTGLLDTAVAGAVVDCGYFDAVNGIFLRQNGASGLQLIRRTSTSGSVVDNAVAQASWNLDPLNGTGPSGVTFDVTKVFILVIDLQFLGMGRVRVGFDIGGTIIPVHEFLNANVITTPYMQTATLPVQMLLTATATGSTKTCYFKCASVSSEGGLADDFAVALTVPEAALTAGNATRTHFISLRPKTTYNGIANRSTLVLDFLELAVTGANPVLWELCVGQAISGSTAFTDINTTYSASEYNITGTISGSPTIVIASGYCAAGSSSKSSIGRLITSRYPLTLDRAGAVRALGTVSLLATGISGTSTTRAVLNFREIR